MAAAVPRVLVFPALVSTEPGDPTRARFDFRVAGIQFWLAERCLDLGLEGASGLGHRQGGDPHELATTLPPTDAEIRDTLVAAQARYGVLTSYTMLASGPVLAVARLVEVRRGHPLHKLGRWTFVDEAEADHLAAVAHLLFRRVAERLGFVLAPTTWQEMFGTQERAVAGSFLTALGCHAAADSGFRVDEPDVALRAILSGVATGMQPAIDVLPHLLRSLRASGSAPIDMLAAALRGALELVAQPPASWEEIRRELGVAEPTLPN